MEPASGKYLQECEEIKCCRHSSVKQSDGDSSHRRTVSISDDLPKASQDKLQDEVDSRTNNDCKLWEEMKRKMFRAYDLVALPKRKHGLFYPEDTEIAYLNNNIFPVLLPGLCKTLQLAKLTNSLQFHWKAFNGIDFIAEYLWNNNPKHPFRTKRGLFKIPFVKRHLKEHPRKPYTKSSFFTEDQAATVIQAGVKGFLVRCHPDVAEMRNFWKTLKQEKMDAVGRGSEQNSQTSRTNLRKSSTPKKATLIIDECILPKSDSYLN